MRVETLENRRLLALNPTGAEQEFMQLVNRFRTDPPGEFSRLMSSVSPLTARDADIQLEIDFAEVNGTVLRNELQALPPVHPVAWNEAVKDFTASHNTAMIQAKQHFHSNTLARRQALLDAGVNLRFAQGESINTENVFGFGKSTIHTYGSYVIDWLKGGPNGMNATRSHRAAIHNDDFEQAGHTISDFNGSGFGPRVHSQVLVNIENPPLIVTGAIFEDSNGSTWYEEGEGIGPVQFVFEGAAGTFNTTGFATGGYQIALPAGTYSATASGGGMNFTQRKSNIVVTDTNVWLNWIYDPDAIPADALESNNSLGTATELNGSNQSFNDLSIHTGSDVDLFKLTSLSNGNVNLSLQFSQSAGDLDLHFLSSSGSVLATSASNTNNESLSVVALRNQVYYVRVVGAGGATNPNYSLTINPPQPQAPVASSDRSSVNGASSKIVTILSNDSDPDGIGGALTPSLTAGSPAAFSMTTDNRVRYEPPAGFSGVDRASYTIVDDQGLESSAAQIEVFVIDFTDPTPWQNNRVNHDVNDDGVTTPIDALLVINDLNNRQARQLPTSPAGASGMFGFVDPSGDGFVSPLDALLVINDLNANGEGESDVRGPLAARVEATDWAVAQLMAAEGYADLAKRRKEFID